MFTSPNPTLAYAKAGKLRAIAMTSAKRSPATPELPTVAEAGNFPGYEASLWRYGASRYAARNCEPVTRRNNQGSQLTRRCRATHRLCH